MVVQLASPCRVRYRRRAEVAAPAGVRIAAAGAAPAALGPRIRVDRDLCQGHGVCMMEAPGHFRVEKVGTLTLLSDTVSPEQREQVLAAVRHCPTRALSLVEN
jgi:sterol 14-demethylase